MSSAKWVFYTRFFDRPEIVDFGGLGGRNRPRDPFRSTLPAPHIRNINLHQKSAPETNSKAVSWPFFVFWVLEGSLAGFPSRRERALDLACGADFSCKLMCGAGPDLGESRGSASAENPGKTGPKISSQTAFRYPVFFWDVEPAFSAERVFGARVSSQSVLVPGLGKPECRLGASAESPGPVVPAR